MADNSGIQAKGTGEAELELMEQMIQQQSEVEAAQKQEQPVQPQPEPEADSTDPTEKLEEIYKETDASLPEEDLPPVEIRGNDDLMRDWFSRKTTAALTRARQKDSKKLKSVIEELKPEEVFEKPLEAAPVNAPTLDEIRQKLPSENREELEPVIDTFSDIAKAHMRPLLEQQNRLAAQQQHQTEISHFRELQETYKGFNVTKEMVDKAKLAQSSVPQASGMTVAQIILQQNQRDFYQFDVQREVAKQIESLNNEPHEHPGGKPTASEARTPDLVNSDSMSFEDFESLLEDKLGVAE